MQGPALPFKPRSASDCVRCLLKILLNKESIEGPDGSKDLSFAGRTVLYGLNNINLQPLVYRHPGYGGLSWEDAAPAITGNDIYLIDYTSTIDRSSPGVAHMAGSHNVCIFKESGRFYLVDPNSERVQWVPSVRKWLAKASVYAITAMVGMPWPSHLAPQKTSESSHLHVVESH